MPAVPSAPTGVAWVQQPPVVAPGVIPWPEEGQAAWRDVLPKVPSPGWMTGLGYPEPRYVVIAQWHDSEDRNLNAMRHIHNEVAIPRVVRTPTLLLEQRALNFHWQGGSFESFRKVVQRTWSGQEILPAPLKESEPGLFKVRIPDGPAGHIKEFYGPTLLDLSEVGPEPRWIELELDVQSIRPDGKGANARFTKLRIFCDLANTGAIPGPTPDVRMPDRFSTEGWVGTDFGYLSLDSWGWRKFDSDPPSSGLFFLPKGRPGVELQLLVMKNPNLHKHDVPQKDGTLGPDYGEILLEKTFVMPAQMKDRDAFKIPHPPMVPRDKVLARIADANDPDIGAGATLLGLMMGHG